MRGLQGKNVLITGASSGIGQAIAVRFAQEGAHVAVNYYKGEAEAKATIEQMHAASKAAGIAPGSLKDMTVQANVAKEEDVAIMFDKVISNFGGLDILINNAGMQIQGASHEIPLDQFDRMIDINMRGAFLCARKAIAHFFRSRWRRHRQRL